MLFSLKSRLALLLTCLSACSFGLHAETVNNALEKCSQETNSLKRLVCFDQIAKNIRQYEGGETELSRRLPVPTVQATPPTAVSKPSTANTAVVDNEQDAVDAFGKPEKSERDSYIEGDSMVATVQEVKQLATRKHRFTLSDGQVWEQTSSDSGGIPKKGDTVIFEKGVLGSFFMKKQGSKRRLRVKRIS